VSPVQITHAGTFSDFKGKVKAIFLGTADAAEDEDTATSQTIALFKPVVVDQSSTDAESSDASSSDALQATTGSLRVSTEEIDYPVDDTISVYEVKNGDTLATIAKLFGVSKNTIMWANDLKSEKITPGDTLVILPMTGIKHNVKKGDSISSIAKKYKADADEIAQFNGISAKAVLAVGDIVLVPEGEITVVQTVKTATGKIVTTSKLLDTYNNITPSGFLIRPVVGGRKTQGLHGHNGIDIAAPSGTSVIASGAGRVIIARVGSYNGGYGNMVVISHDGGVQTVYAHLRTVNVNVGQSVVQGQIIGQVGNTGKSTGPHLHFEVRGAKNPF
jgi:murein DD-endopeptidase MepM/ murein hydrolase activator NlpD